MLNRKLSGLALGAGVAVLVVACATSPLGRRQFKLVSDSEVTTMGVASFTDLKKKTPATQDAATARYVQCVAGYITAEIPDMKWNVSVPGSWEVVTFQDDQVNAFALPGGKIGVYTGLLKVANTQDQLAAVIGHEVTHVLAGHSAERVSSNMAGQLGTSVISAATGIDPSLIGAATQTLILLPYSRSHETEADLLGLDLMAGAGFDPHQSVTLWQNMAKNSGGQKPPELMSTHPSDSTRIANLNARMPHAMELYNAAKAQGKRPSCK